MRPFEFLPHEYFLVKLSLIFLSVRNMKFVLPSNFWLSLIPPLFHENAGAPRGSILHPIHVLEISISIANFRDVAPV